MSELTNEMKNRIKNSVRIENLSFKYSLAFDIDSPDEPAKHRAMCKGEITGNKWVWVGGNDGAFTFDSEEQARLFVKEIQAEAKRRSEV